MDENKNEQNETVIETTATEKEKKKLSRTSEIIIGVILALIGILLLIGTVICLCKTRGTQLLYIDSTVGRRYGHWKIYLIIGIIFAAVGIVMFLHGCGREKINGDGSKESETSNDNDVSENTDTSSASEQLQLPPSDKETDSQ